MTSYDAAPPRTAAGPVRVTRDGPVTVVEIDRPAVRNAVDRAPAEALHDAFVAFEEDATASVAVLTGAHGTFCAGADLQAIAGGDVNRFEPDGPAPLGCTRLRLSKPVIAAVEGYAVAGGLELAIWADLRVAASDAVFGVFCRRFGVPLIDGGTVRLPRLIGQSRAMDLVLTGREVGAEEALAMGLANRVVDPGTARSAAVAWAHELAALPQTCLRHDRLSMLEQWGLSEEGALHREYEHGAISLADPDGALAGAARFAAGVGRHGARVDATSPDGAASGG